MSDIQKNPGAAVEQELKIQRWEIWYVYSFYLTQDLPGLNYVGQRIASSGLVRGLVTEDGRLGWKDGGQFKMSPPSERDNHRSRNTEVNFLGHIVEELRLPIFKLLARRSAERHIFGVTSDIPEQSLRVLLPDFVIVHPRTGLKLQLETTVQIFNMSAWAS